MAHQSILLAHAPDLAAKPNDNAQEAEKVPEKWLIFADEEAVGGTFGGACSGASQKVCMVYPGKQFEKVVPDKYVLNPANPTEFQRLLDEVTDGDNSIRSGIVHCWALNESFPGEKRLSTAKLTTELLTAAQDTTCQSVLHLVQSLVINGIEPYGLWLVTRGAQPVPTIGGTFPPPTVPQATLWGLGRVISQEHPGI